MIDHASRSPPRRPISRTHRTHPTPRTPITASDIHQRWSLSLKPQQQVWRTRSPRFHQVNSRISDVLTTKIDYDPSNDTPEAFDAVDDRKAKPADTLRGQDFEDAPF